MQQDTEKQWYMGCKTVVEGSEAEKKRHLRDLERKGMHVIQPKCDGNFAAIHGGATLDVRSRTVKRIKNHGLPGFRSGVLVVGELSRSSQQASRERERLGHDFFDAFDILFFGGDYIGNKPAAERRKFLHCWYKGIYPDRQRFFRVLPAWTDRFIEHYEEEPEAMAFGLLIAKQVIGLRSRKNTPLMSLLWGWSFQWRTRKRQRPWSSSFASVSSITER